MHVCAYMCLMCVYCYEKSNIINPLYIFYAAILTQLWIMLQCVCNLLLNKIDKNDAFCKEISRSTMT